MDDIIVKSEKEESTPENLSHVFYHVQKIGMKLNQKKCTFGVLAGNV